MSTSIENRPGRPLRSEEDLYGYFESFAKPREARRVGLEAEFFGVDRRTGRALPYDGPEGIEAVLKTLAGRFGYEPILENGRVIAIRRSGTVIGLEPGGQVELSAPPVFNIFEIECQIETFIREISSLSGDFPGAAWLAAGIHPFSRLEDIAWVPKTRYRIMAEHLRTRGALSHHMMKRTATNQVNVDYLSEAEALANLRTALGITSIVSALFANASISEGRPNGFVSERLHIWNHMDPARSGLLPEFCLEGRTFRDYLEYLLAMPLLFIVRNGEWIPAGTLNFRDFLRDGFSGARATLADFELHLSTAFPEVRVKQYIEVRGVDGQCPRMIPAVAAFWKGIFYDEQTSQKAWELVSFATSAERERLHQEVPRKGLEAELGGRPILPLAGELVELACASLGRQKHEGELDECRFLGRIREWILRPGQSPGKTLLEKWRGDLKENPQALIDYLSLKPSR